MVYNYSEDNKELAYDLRQRYAEIVGVIIDEIAGAIKEKRFTDWFDLMTDSLICEIDQKLKDKERELYEDTVEETIKIINLHRNAYLGESTDPKQINEIKIALRELYKLMRLFMEKHNMFGVKDYDEGL